MGKKHNKNHIARHSKPQAIVNNLHNINTNNNSFNNEDIKIISNSSFDNPITNFNNNSHSISNRDSSSIVKDIQVKDIQVEKLPAEMLKTLYEPMPEPRKLSDYVLVGQGISHQLYYGKNTIGRLPSNDIHIDKGNVSREHAVITVLQDKVQILDSSLNGTRVNFERIKKDETLTIKVDDEIAICVDVFSLQVERKIEDLIIPGIGSELAFVQNSYGQSSNSNANRLNSRGFSLIELLIVITVIGIIAAISIPNLISTRRAANSASAIQTMRLIATSQASYGAGVGNGEYATVDNLVREQYVDATVGAASLPSQSTAQQPKSGYVFFFNTIPSDPSTNTLAGYSVSARPLVNGSNSLIVSGNKSFYVDNSSVIKVSASPLAPYADANSAALN